jgi:hypothetical protein
MILTPANTPVVQRVFKSTITVYQGQIWISRQSWKVMGCPKKIAFELLPTTLAVHTVEPDQHGFELRAKSGSEDMWIYNRPLCRALWKRFKATDSLRFEVLKHGSIYELKLSNQF